MAVERSDSCSQHRLITVEDFRLSSLHTIRDMRILDDASYVQETGHPAYRADDALWLFPTVYKYVSETGNVAFIDEVIPFANKDEGTVYEHLKRAIDFSMNHLGKHGMPAGLYADWNDCTRLGADGESTFVALQFYYAMTILKEFAAYKKDDEYITYLDESQENSERSFRALLERGQIYPWIYRGWTGYRKA